MLSHQYSSAVRQTGRVAKRGAGGWAGQCRAVQCRAGQGGAGRALRLVLAERRSPPLPVVVLVVREHLSRFERKCTLHTAKTKAEYLRPAPRPRPRPAPAAHHTHARTQTQQAQVRAGSVRRSKRYRRDAIPPQLVEWPCARSEHAHVHARLMQAVGTGRAAVRDGGQAAADRNAWRGAQARSYRSRCSCAGGRTCAGVGACAVRRYTSQRLEARTE